MTRYTLKLYRSPWGVITERFDRFEDALEFLGKLWRVDPHKLEPVEIDNREPTEWWIYEDGAEADEAARTGDSFPPAVLTLEDDPAS